MLKRLLKRWIAGQELEELYRYQVGLEQARRWLSEFPEIGVALDHVQRVGKGVESYASISDIRDYLRKRQRATSPKD